MTEVLAETGGFEIQTSAQIQTEGDVDYSLLERRLDAALLDLGPSSVELLQEMFSTSDSSIHSLAVDVAYQALAKGVETGQLGNADLDNIRNLLLAEMQSDDENHRYDAQEAFAIHEARLAAQDKTTHLWLGQHILRDWFNG